MYSSGMGDASWFRYWYCNVCRWYGMGRSSSCIQHVCSSMRVFVLLSWWGKWVDVWWGLHYNCNKVESLALIVVQSCRVLCFCSTAWKRDGLKLSGCSKQHFLMCSSSLSVLSIRPVVAVLSIFLVKTFWLSDTSVFWGNKSQMKVWVNGESQTSENSAVSLIGYSLDIL